MYVVDLEVDVDVDVLEEVAADDDEDEDAVEEEDEDDAVEEEDDDDAVEEEEEEDDDESVSEAINASSLPYTSIALGPPHLSSGQPLQFVEHSLESTVFKVNNFFKELPQ